MIDIGTLLGAVVAVREFDGISLHGSPGRVESLCSEDLEIPSDDRKGNSRNTVGFRRVGGSHEQDRTMGRIQKPALCQAGDNKNRLVCVQTAILAILL